MVSRSSLFFGGAACLAIASCEALLSLDDLRARDAAPDVPVTPDASRGTLIALAGSVSSATGKAQQTHVFYAPASQTWWLFFLDGGDPNVMKTRFSKTFDSWSDGPKLTLPIPHDGDGRNFSVVSKTIGGADVLHLALGLRVSASERRHYHVRATLSPALAFGPPVLVRTLVHDEPKLDPEGTVSALAQDNALYDMSPWTPDNLDAGIDVSGGLGNANAWRSTDDGMSFALEHIERVSEYVNANAFVPLSSGEALAFWEAGDKEPDASNVRFSRRTSTWSGPSSVFDPDATQSDNDWNVVRVRDNDVHAVRRTSAGAYEHRRYDGNAWSPGNAIPASSAKFGSGIFLATDSKDVMLYAIAADAASTVVTTRWNGTAWSMWSAFVVGVTDVPAARNFLSGWSDGAGKVALIWTQTSGGAFEIDGVVK